MSWFYTNIRNSIERANLKSEAKMTYKTFSGHMKVHITYPLINGDVAEDSVTVTYMKSGAYLAIDFDFDRHICITDIGSELLSHFLG